MLGRFDDLSLPGMAAHDDVDDLVAFAETHATRKRIVGTTFQDTEQEPALLEGRPNLSPQDPCVDAQEIDVCGGTADAADGHGGRADQGVGHPLVFQKLEHLGQQAHPMSSCITADRRRPACPARSSRRRASSRSSP